LIGQQRNAAGLAPQAWGRKGPGYLERGLGPFSKETMRERVSRLIDDGDASHRASRPSWAPKIATSQKPLVRKLSALVRAHIPRMRGSEHSYRAHGNSREKPQSLCKRKAGAFARHKLESPVISDEAYSSRITWTLDIPHQHTSCLEAMPRW